jgi:hypothetical protein
MQNARVANVGFADFQPIFQKLEKSGGEIAFSAICDRSNRPLVRIRFSPPPIPDEKISVMPLAPAPLSDAGSPFEKDEREKAHQVKVEAHNRQVDEHRKLINDHKARLEQHQKESAERIAKAKPDIEAILKAPRNCEETDIQNSIQRANLFFNEPSDRLKTRRFALFITDGIDSFSQAPASLAADSEVIVVNGSADVGIFNKIKHERLESPEKAIAYLAGLL